MRRLLLFLSVLGGAVSLIEAATPLYITPDVPMTPGAALVKPPPCAPGGEMLPWEIYRYTVPPTYTCVFSVPGNPHLDGIHRLDTPGDWLFSVEAPSDLGGALLPAGTVAEPGDVIHYDSSAGTYTLCFDASAIATPIPSGVNVDSLYREGNGTGDLLVSFDVPVDLGGFPTFLASDLVRFVKTGPPAGAICPAAPGGWALAAANPAFSATAAGIALSDNEIGVDACDATTLFSFDVPTDLLPGPVTYTPNQIVSFTGGAFALYETLGGWVPGTNVDGLSCPANPGVVPATLFVNMTLGPNLDTDPTILSWSASCSQAEDYGIYEGTIGAWYSHTAIDCNDAGGDLMETITPAAGSKYYLVVPHNNLEEGSYGTCLPATACGSGQRPVGGAVCATPQVITPCPPP